MQFTLNIQDDAFAERLNAHVLERQREAGPGYVSRNTVVLELIAKGLGAAPDEPKAGKRRKS
jgi:hypothetical protein